VPDARLLLVEDDVDTRESLAESFAMKQLRAAIRTCLAIEEVA
jgi:hypothetical protein